LIANRTELSTGPAEAKVSDAAAADDGKRKWCQIRRVATSLRRQIWSASVDSPLRRRVSTPQKTQTITDLNKWSK